MSLKSRIETVLFLTARAMTIEEIAEICVQAWNKEEMESSLIDFLSSNLERITYYLAHEQHNFQWILLVYVSRPNTSFH